MFDGGHDISFAAPYERSLSVITRFGISSTSRRLKGDPNTARPHGNDLRWKAVVLVAGARGANSCNYLANRKLLDGSFDIVRVYERNFPVNNVPAER